MHFRRVIAPGRERAKRAIEHSRGRLEGKRITFLPDSQLEVPLARFPGDRAGMQLVEVGTPYLHRRHLARNWRCSRPARSSAKARTSTASSTASAPSGPT
jgi:hypothetical protein